MASRVVRNWIELTDPISLSDESMAAWLAWALCYHAACMLGDVRTYGRTWMSASSKRIPDHVRNEREVLDERLHLRQRAKAAALEEHRVGARGGGAVVQCVGRNKQRSDFD